MSFKSRLVRLWNSFEDLFLKNHSCISCRREIVDGTRFSLCKNCLDEIEKLSGNLCKICGDCVLEDNLICDRCKLCEYSFDESKSFAIYEDIASKLVKRFKYSGKKYYAKHLAELMVLNKNYFDEIDIITFVPIGEKRRKERGFNQAEELAKEIGKLTNIPVFGILEKIGTERHQAGLSQKDRQKNLSGTLKFASDLDVDLKGKTILLIDDVFTTGATLSECSKVLKSDKRNKPAKICCYTFAKTRLNSTNNGHFQQKFPQEIKTKSN